MVGTRVACLQPVPIPHMGWTLSSLAARVCIKCLACTRAREKTIPGRSQRRRRTSICCYEELQELCLLLPRYQDRQLLDGHVLVDVAVILSRGQPAALQGLFDGELLARLPVVYY